MHINLLQMLQEFSQKTYLETTLKQTNVLMLVKTKPRAPNVKRIFQQEQTWKSINVPKLAKANSPAQNVTGHSTKMQTLKSTNLPIMVETYSPVPNVKRIQD